MSPADIIILLATGIGAGFASGLLGIGGGFIMTPMQFIVYSNMGLPTDTAIKLAFGTTLLVVFPTALSGAWRHSAKGAVQWKAAVIMGLCGTAVSFLGAILAAHLPGVALKIAFGILILVSSFRMLTARPPKVEQSPRTEPWRLIAWAIPIGLVTGILGIGAGVIMVPILMLGLRFRIHNAAATSLAIMIFNSFGGVIGYVASGLDAPGLPPYSIGYVDLASGLLLAAASVGMAQVGALAAHRLPARQLRFIFIVLMLYMGLKMVGVFTWLGWPI